MKKIKITAVLFIGLSLPIRAQWAQQIGNINSDFSNSIALDNFGNLVQVGMIEDNLNDISITILNQNTGSIIWNKVMGSDKDDVATDVAIDNSGNIYITGSFGDSVDFNTNFPTPIYLKSKGRSDIFILKIDNSGNLIWVKSIGGIYEEEGTSIALDQNNNVYIGGTYRTNNVDFDPGSGYSTITLKAQSDNFVLKLDSNGNFVWVKAIHGLGTDYLNSIYVDGNNLYTVGVFSGTIDLDPSSSTANFASNGMQDIFIQKMDNNGNYIWGKTIGGNAKDIVNDITVGANNNVVLVGSFASDTVDFDPGLNANKIAVEGFSDLFILNLDNQGNFNWVKIAGGFFSNTSANAVFYDSTNLSTYITGSFDAPADLDLDPSISSTVNSNGAEDILFLSIGSDGSLLYKQELGGNGSDVGNAVIGKVGLDIYIAGSFKNTVDFAYGFGTNNLSSLGLEDAFVTQLTLPSVSVAKVNPNKTHLYPNPSNGIVTFAFETMQNEIEIKILTVQGEVVYSEKYYNIFNSTIEFANQPAGIYFFEITNVKDKTATFYKIYKH